MTRQFDETTLDRMLAACRGSASAMPPSSVSVTARGGLVVIEMPTESGPVRFAWVSADARSFATLATSARRLLSRVAAIPDPVQVAVADDNAGGPPSWYLRAGGSPDPRILRLIASALGPGESMDFVMPGPGWDASVASRHGGHVHVTEDLSDLTDHLPAGCHMRITLDHDGVPLFQMDAVRQSAVGMTDTVLVMRERATLDAVLR